MKVILDSLLRETKNRQKWKVDNLKMKIEKQNWKAMTKNRQKT